MKPFRFFNNKIRHPYREMVDRCLQDAIRWDLNYTEVQESFQEHGISKKFWVSNVMIHHDCVEVNFRVECNNFELSESVFTSYFIIPLDEYMELINVESYRELYRRTL